MLIERFVLCLRLIFWCIIKVIRGLAEQNEASGTASSIIERSRLLKVWATAKYTS